MTVLAPDLSFGATYPLAQRGERGFLIMLPRAVDDQGRVYFQVRGGFQGIPDSAAVGRYNRETSRIDTLAMVKLQDYKSSESGGGNRREQMVMPVPLTRQDGWSASWDGRVAIVRSNDYHVEWIQPDGSVVRGSAVSAISHAMSLARVHGCDSTGSTNLRAESLDRVLLEIPAW